MCKMMMMMMITMKIMDGDVNDYTDDEDDVVDEDYDDRDLNSTPRLPIDGVSPCAALIFSALCHYPYYYPTYHIITIMAILLLTLS